MVEINDTPINNSRVTLHNRIKIRTLPWSAVAAGVIVGLGIQVVFNLLGLGVGATAFDINSSNITIRSVVSISWILLSGIIAMFLGGWVAGNLSYRKNTLEHVMLGLTTWSAATLITFFFTFSAAGILFSNTLSLTKQSLELVGKGTASLAQAAPQMAETAKNLFPDLTNLQDKIIQKAEEVFSEEKIKTMTDSNSLETLKKELKEIVVSLVTADNEDATNAAKERTLAFLTDKLGFERSQAEELMNAWLDKYTQLKEQATDAANKAKDKAAATTEKIVNSLGTAALITALAFISSAFAAVIGAVAARKG